MYDFIIVGAGPSGLTLAYLLGNQGNKCLLIDKNNNIGGCHRVNRVNGLFTEHGPRIYSSSYLNTITLLEKMNIKFTDIFTRYNFNFTNIGGNAISHFTFTEILKLGWEYLKFIVNNQYGKDMSVKDFANKHGFTTKATNYMNRLCHLTDGVGSDRYTLFKFLQLFNQQLLYPLYQPKKPNDIGIFPQMLKAIIDTDNVTIKLNKTVTKINTASNKIKGITIGTEFIHGTNVILAIPPLDMSNLISNNPETISAFGNLKEWTRTSTYDQYIPVTFHWNTKLELPHVWGFPQSDWGIVFIVLSDYMEFDNNQSKTVISTCISMVDKKSKSLNKTANEVVDKNILIQEVFSQLKQSFPNIPKPSASILHPGVKRINNKWVENDTAYILTPNNNYIKFGGSVQNLYNVGTQNGYSPYSFTSFESAVANAFEFVNKNKNNKIKIRSPFSVRKLILILFVSWCILWLIILLIILVSRI